MSSSESGSGRYSARRVFNDPEQVEQIVSILEAAGGQG